jgi:uncharacterized protein (TIGR03545 family)/uncharacterized protein (TIGR03546 family)
MTPLDSMHNFVVLFFVLVLNINFGIYLIATAFFSALAYLIDPLFDIVGYSILTAGALEPLFTSMYNSDFMILTNFNNTIVMGSVVVSLALAMPLYILANRLIALYRDTIATKLNANPYTKYLYILGSSDGSKAGIFRWWGVGLFAIIGAIIYLVSTIFLDYFLRVSIEKSLQNTLDTDVKIERLDSQLDDGKLSISKIVVYDKDDTTKALVTVGKAEIDLMYSPMLRKKLFAQNIELSSVVINKDAPSIKSMDREDRQAKSAIDSTKAGIKSAVDSIELSSGGSMDIANLSVDDILAKESLSTITEANKIKESIANLKDKYKNIKDSGLNSNFVDEIKRDIAQIKGMKNDALSIAKKIEKISKVEKKIRAKKDEIKAIKDTFTKEQKNIQYSIAKLKNAPSDDLAKLKSKYTLDFAGGYNVLDTLLKDDISGYKEYAQLAYNKLKPYLNKKDDNDSSQNQNIIIRDDGRWILYKETNPLPLVVVQNSRVDVEFKDKKFDIKIKDLSSDQNIYRHPMIATLDSSSKDYKSLKANIISDRVSNIEKLDISVDNLLQKSIDAKKLLLKDSTIDIKANANISNLETIVSKIDVEFVKTSIAMKDTKQKYEQILNSTLETIGNFELNISLKDKLIEPSISIESNIDDKLNSAMKDIFKKQQDKLMSKLETKLKERLNINLNSINSDNSSLLSQANILDKDNLKLDNLLKDALSSKKDSPLNNIGVDNLKGLFKF